MITKAPHLDAFCLCLYFILLKNCYIHLFKTGSLCISVAWVLIQSIKSWVWELVRERAMKTILEVRLPNNHLPPRPCKKGSLVHNIWPFLVISLCSLFDNALAIPPFKKKMPLQFLHCGGCKASNLISLPALHPYYPFLYFKYIFWWHHLGFHKCHNQDHINNWRETALILTSVLFLAAGIWFIGEWQWIS